VERDDRAGRPERRAGGAVEVEQDHRLVRIEQLRDAHLRDGVVRNLPAAFARAALHPPVAPTRAVLDLQEDLEHGGIGLGDVFALPEVACVAGSYGLSRPRSSMTGSR